MGLHCIPMATRTKLVRIGNSRGIRIPAAFLSTIGATNELDLDLVDGTVVLRPVRAVREGWAEAFAEMAKTGEDKLLDDYIPTSFDENEWQWP